MKSKVINLFNDKTNIQKDGVKYSDLVDRFLAPFENDFPEDFYMEDIFEFTINAWNLANMSMIVPENEFENLMATVPDQDLDTILLKKMIKHKVANFKEYNHFISDFEITDDAGKPTITVVTQSKEFYLEELMETAKNEPSEDDFKENYINRYAIVLKPQQPFFDWINSLYPDEEIIEIDRPNIYLVDDGIDDLEKWLQKKFDKLFMKQLFDWHTNKKDWPQKRNFKMFKQWFQIDVSDMVFDLENLPVFKEQ